MHPGLSIISVLPTCTVWIFLYTSANFHVHTWPCPGNCYGHIEFEWIHWDDRMLQFTELQCFYPLNSLQHKHHKIWMTKKSKYHLSKFIQCPPWSQTRAVSVTRGKYFRVILLKLILQNISFHFVQNNPKKCKPKKKCRIYKLPDVLVAFLK